METPPGYTQYPRYRPDDRQYHGQPDVRFGAIGEAWSLVWKDLGTWVVAGLVMIVLSYAAQVPGQIYQYAAEMDSPSRGQLRADVLIVSILSGLAGNVVQILLMAGFWRIAIMRFRGTHSTIGDMFNLNGMGTQVLVFGAILMGAAAVVVLPMFGLMYGMLGAKAMDRWEVNDILMIFTVAGVVGLAMLVAYAGVILTPAVIVDQRLPAVEAMKVTWAAVRPHLLKMVGVYIVASIIAGLGVFACCIGLLFTLPVLNMTLAVVYRDLFIPPQTNPAQTEAPWAGGFEA
jgi:hypothetical protein